MEGKRPRTVVFDLGGVLIDWDPRYLYRKILPGDEAVECFLTTVCTPSWNREQDAGRPFAEGCALLKQDHPHHAHLIDAWFARYEEMLAGPMEGAVEVLSELRANQLRLFALSNWSSETFPFAQRRFEFLRWFQGILLSGEEKLVKPDPRFFRLLFERYSVDPDDAIFIDDQVANVEAARRLGMHAIQFINAPTLRRDLVRLAAL